MSPPSPHGHESEFAHPLESVEVDVAVVGGGPAGIAAALWLGRYRRHTVLLDRGEPRNRWVDAAHGYLGFDGTNPAVLLEHARGELDRYDTVTRRLCGVARARAVAAPAAQDSVTGAEPGGDAGLHFTLLTDDGEVIARRVVIATGDADELPQITGFDEHFGADVVTCSACDGYEARDRPVVVLGNVAKVAGFAVSLLDWAASVCVVEDSPEHDPHSEGPLGESADARRALDRAGIGVVRGRVEAFVGRRGSLCAVALRDGTVIACERVFLGLGNHPVTALAEQLGCRVTSTGHVEIDESGATSVPGVFACGDLTPGAQLIARAVASGTVAGIGAARSLWGAGPVPGRPTPAPDPAELEL